MHLLLNYGNVSNFILKIGLEYCIVLIYECDNMLIYSIKYRIFYVQILYGDCSVCIYVFWLRYILLPAVQVGSMEFEAKGNEGEFRGSCFNSLTCEVGFVF
jgi:hypothetical protein